MNNKLTNRETQVAELVAWGASQKEVANHLGIARRTVDNIIRKIYDKLSIGKINELSAWWFCTHFNISFELSPIKRKIGAMALLCIFLIGEFNNDTAFCRTRSRRVNRTEYRVRSKN